MDISFVLGHELPFPPEKGGGVNSLLMSLCKSLAVLGHNVTAYSPTVIERPNEEVIDNVRHIRVRGAERRLNHYQNFMAGAPYALKIKEKLTEGDVISCHLWQGFLFSKTKKAKIVTHTIHRDPKKILYLFSQLDRIYTGSDAVTDDAVRTVPVLSKKIRTIYNCVDFTGYPQPSPRGRDECVQFLFVGRFSNDKGLALFIHAFCEAALVNDTIKFKTIGPLTDVAGGDESLVKTMRDFVEQKGLSERVEFMEPIFDRNKLDEEIKNCDVVVLPSTGGETLNMSILECMRLGRALLISDLPANMPLNLEGKTGYFAQVGDLKSWKDKILQMASDITLVEEFGKNAYAYGKSNFSSDQIAASYVQDFEELIRVKKRN